MRVVDLDRDEARQLVEAALLPLQPREDILQRGADEEILLLETQLAPRGCAVMRIEHAGQAFPLDLAADGAEMVALVEAAQIEFARRACRPQPQGVHGVRAKARHRHIECGRQHLAGIEPAVTDSAMLVGLGNDSAIEADGIAEIRPRELPRGAIVQPDIGFLMLPAALDSLREHAELIADAIAIGRNARSRRALEQAGGK